MGGCEKSGNHKQCIMLEGASLARENAPFERLLQVGEPAAQRATSVLSLLPQFSNLPFDQATQLFAVNEAARGIADTDIQRRNNEIVRAQGGQLNQLLALLSGTPLTNTQFGPSQLSQIGGFIGNLAKFLPLV